MDPAQLIIKKEKNNMGTLTAINGMKYLILAMPSRKSLHNKINLTFDTDQCFR